MGLFDSVRTEKHAQHPPWRRVLVTQSALAAALAVVLSVVSAPAVAESEPSPPADDPVTGVVHVPATTLQDFLDVVAPAVESFSPSDRDSSAEAAGDAAALLQDALISVRPHDCYLRAYARLWRVQGDFLRMARASSPEAASAGSESLTDDLQASVEALETAASACEIVFLEGATAPDGGFASPLVPETTTPSLSEVTVLAADALKGLDVNSRSSARTAASSLRETLLAISPAPCYAESYAAYWAFAFGAGAIAAEDDEDTRAALTERFLEDLEWVRATLSQDGVDCASTD